VETLKFQMIFATLGTKL